MGRGVSASTLMLPDGRGVTLAKLRQVIRNNGFVSKKAQAAARKRVTISPIEARAFTSSMVTGIRFTDESRASFSRRSSAGRNCSASTSIRNAN